MIASRGKRGHKLLFIYITICICLLFTSCGKEEPSTGSVKTGSPVSQDAQDTTVEKTTVDDSFIVPEYEGEPSIELDGNIPDFDNVTNVGDEYEEYGELDSLGRCTQAFANVSVDTQPGATEERGDISIVHPSGWMSDQGWERCHLIGWQLTGENANERNLITGTHFMNVSGMLPYENEIRWYIEETGNHVLYRVTPRFKGNNLIASGVQMEAESVEDDGEGIQFNIFCFNVDPEGEINYKTGEIKRTEEQRFNSNSKNARKYTLNTFEKTFHYPSCEYGKDTASQYKEDAVATRQELLDQGYSPCEKCEP